MIKFCLLGLCLLTSLTFTHAINYQSINYTQEDSLIFNRIIKQSKIERWAEQPIGEVVTKTAQWLINTPYVAATLEKNDQERLVINLRELDCTTFLENVLAISQCIVKQHNTFTNFACELTQIRYRNGIIDGYPSRLHYFTEWLVDHQKRGFITLISEEIGDAPFNSQVSFMSTHPSSYKALSTHPEFVEAMRKTEADVSAYQLKQITTNHLPQVENQIKDGDIIAFSTTIDGLDISHVAFAIHQNGKLCFIHASTSAHKVVIAEKSIYEYLLGSKRNDGILVGRMMKMK
jgi:hypothetical protein